MSEVLIITGPPGAGKSSTCEVFADTGDGMWAVIEQDAIRKSVKAEEAHTQWDTSIGICGDMARRYQQRGVGCIIDCFVAPGSIDQWDKALLGIDYQLVVLLPDVEVAIERNNRRSGDAKLSESKVRERYEWITAWSNDKRARIIDTSKLSVHGVVQAIRSGSRLSY